MERSPFVLVLTVRNLFWSVEKIWKKPQKHSIFKLFQNQIDWWDTEDISCKKPSLLRISRLFKPTFRHESKGITYVKISFQFSKAQSSLNAKSCTKRARCALARTSSYKTSIARGPSLYYVSKETGWVRSEKWQFLLTFSTIYADKGWVGWSEKVQKSADVI